MSETLKPCPFCGGSRVVRGTNVGTVRCGNGCSAHVDAGHISDAIAAWNRRADSPDLASLRAENERLTRERDEARGELEEAKAYLCKTCGGCGEVYSGVTGPECGPGCCEAYSCPECVLPRMRAEVRAAHAREDLDEAKARTEKAESEASTLRSSLAEVEGALRRMRCATCGWPVEAVRGPHVGGCAGCDAARAALSPQAPSCSTCDGKREVLAIRNEFDLLGGGSRERCPSCAPQAPTREEPETCGARPNAEWSGCWRPAGHESWPEDGKHLLVRDGVKYDWPGCSDDRPTPQEPVTTHRCMSCSWTGGWGWNGMRRNAPDTGLEHYIFDGNEGTCGPVVPMEPAPKEPKP